MDGLSVKYRHHDVFTNYLFLVFHGHIFLHIFFAFFLFFFYLNQKGLKLGKEIEHGGKEERQNINLSVKMNTEEYCDLLDFSPFFQKPQNIFQYVHYHWYPQHQ